MPTRTAPSLGSVLGELLESRSSRWTWCARRTRRATRSTSHRPPGRRLGSRAGAQGPGVVVPAAAGSPSQARLPLRPATEMRGLQRGPGRRPAGPPAASASSIIRKPVGGGCSSSGSRGVELFQVGDLAQWKADGSMDRRLSRPARRSVGRPARPQACRCSSTTGDGCGAGPIGRSPAPAAAPPGPCDTCRARAAALWARLADQPTTVVHGELYASNVIVERAGRHTSVSPIDWEMAAIGAGPRRSRRADGRRLETRDRRALEVAYAAAAGRRADDHFDDRPRRLPAGAVHPVARLAAPLAAAGGPAPRLVVRRPCPGRAPRAVTAA